MTNWADITAQEPAFAAEVRQRFTVGRHATMATIRSDGSPRLSGTEVQFGADGEVYLGIMSGARRLADLARDPRLAVHSPSVDPPDPSGAGCPAKPS